MSDKVLRLETLPELEHGEALSEAKEWVERHVNNDCHGGERALQGVLVIGLHENGVCYGDSGDVRELLGAIEMVKRHLLEERCRVR